MPRVPVRFQTTMLFPAVFAALVVGRSSASVRNGATASIQNASFPGALCGSVQDIDRYVDQVFKVEMPRALNHLDPWVLRNYNVTLNATQKISAHFTTLTVTGFRQATRVGKCQSRRIAQNVAATCNVTFRHVVARANLTLRYTGKLFYNIGANCIFSTIFSKFNATAVRGRQTSADLKFVFPLAASVKFTGLKNVPVSPALTKGFLQHVADKIYTFQGLYTQALKRAAQKVPFPY